MRILVVGSGGREHAISWSLSKSGKHSLFCAPGNPGMAELGVLEPVEADNINGLVSLARDRSIDLVVVGPEVPLVSGLGDALRAEGISCFGPGEKAARLEGSKWFAKDVMNSAGVPTARSKVFTDTDSAMEYMGEDASGFVIKADGLAAGKGVFLPDGSDEACTILDFLFGGGLGESGLRVVIEERLKGREVSILAVCSGTDCVILPPSRDHKRLGDGNTGPNTGGMGAICPPPEIEDGFCETVREEIILPVLRELASRGIDYRGVLYAGLMLTDDGPSVLEFNVRFGDPETQAVLPMIEGDLADLFDAAARGGSLPSEVAVKDGCCACVVMASGGYPSSYEKGFLISGLERVEGAVVFHAGTKKTDDGIVTNGGRVLSVVAIGSTLNDALDRTYLELEKIEFKRKYFRNDIGRIV
ncbi:MAG: phosphoribosylamine--glycine ligase [Candidatus Aegiribacteria sp.]|nr:phosphoribosylamine--glycine ligase [Candidatus Aegiribacteria sp.]